MSLVSPGRGFPLARITGDVGTMSRWVDQFDLVAEHLGMLRGAAARATGLPGMGAAITAARADAVGVMVWAGPQVALAQRLSRALSAYARAHDEHASKANALVEEIEAAHARWVGLDEAADRAGRGALAASRGEDAAVLQEAEDAAADAITARKRAEEDLDELWRTYEFHFGAWDEAYDAAVRALAHGQDTPGMTRESSDLLDDLVAADTPAGVLALWLAHPELQEELLGAHPAILGGLDGLPATVRVRANQANAAEWLRQAQAELDELPAGSARAVFVEHEIDYLRLVQGGDMKLYLYDRDDSRIVEIIGELDTPPTRVITYVPGTFTNLGDFYGGEVQKVSAYLEDNAPGTIAFVYKDGLFPGENPDVGGINFFRIGEANDHDRAIDAGRQLARFETGMRVDPLFTGTEHDAFGHSWGLANVTSSEVAGAEFDKVISLSGAGMPAEWRPDPDTSYTDISYDDLLQAGQRLGVVWGGNNPRSHPAFEHGEYYAGPDDEVIYDTPAPGEHPSLVGPWKVLTENHLLIAKDTDDNWRALEDMRKAVVK